MNDGVRKQVIADLTSLPEMEKRIELLRYEMDHRARISPDEMIQALAFGRGDGAGAVNGHISNKTLYIALNYQEKMEQVNAEATNDLAKKLWLLEEERNCILHYIDLLEPRQRELVRLIYIKGKSCVQAAKEMDITVRTARRLKTDTINRLCELYEFTGKMG